MTQFPVSSYPTCVVCHAPIQQAQRQSSINQVLGGPVCRDCAIKKDYNEANTLTMGQPDGAPSFSIEFEVRASGQDLLRAWKLLHYGYLRTEDNSVSDEYKSPRYQAFDEFERVLPLLESLQDLVDGCCGTHIHVNCPQKDWLAIHMMKVFDRLLHHWATHTDETIAFWGRDTAPYGENVRVSNRYDTLEFRLPRFRTAAQYRPVVLFCRQAGQIISGWVENVKTLDAFGRTAPLLSEMLLDLYQQQSATALSHPTWGVHTPLSRPL